MENNKSGMTKRKKIMIAVVTAVICGIVALIVYFVALKPPFEKETATYEKTMSSYNDAVAEYEGTCKKIKEVNDDFQKEIDSLQELVSSEEKPYDETTITNANTAINAGKVALVEIPELEQADVKDVSDFNALQTSSLRSEKKKIKKLTQNIKDATNKLELPDYSETKNQITTAYTELDNSIKQLKQVTCPDEAFVLARMTEIKDVAGMVDLIALTEDTDPENHIGKAGWYTSKVIFQHKDVENYAINSGWMKLAEIGNPAGGCVETYTCVEDAERRNEELAAMEGTVRAPGAHEVCGTLVIRVSEDMKTSTQEQVMAMMKDALLRLE